jgi:endonuclease/exonuclease/phosphatase family metal-dependent hydrolase
MASCRSRWWPRSRPRPWPLERGRRIDHVLVRCAEHGPSLDITACTHAFDQPVGGVWASDHFGVVADLAAAPPEPLELDED